MWQFETKPKSRVGEDSNAAGSASSSASRSLLLRGLQSPWSNLTPGKIGSEKQLGQGEVRKGRGHGKKEGRLGRVCVWETRPEIAVVRFCVFGSSWTCKQGRRMGKNEENRRSCFIGVLSYNGNYETMKTVRVFAFLWWWCGPDNDSSPQYKERTVLSVFPCDNF